MSTKVIAFVCDFCPIKRKRYASKGPATRHEGSCFHNPIRRACATCGNFIKPTFNDHGTMGIERFQPDCEEGLLPVPATDEHDEQAFRADCILWIPRDQNWSGV